MEVGDSRADTGGVAVSRVELGEALAQFPQGPPGLLKFVQSLLHVGEAFVDEVGRVCARCLTLIADGNDLADLAQGEPGGLCMADERDACSGVGWVIAVAAGCAVRLVEQPLGFPVAQRLGGHAGGVGECTDAHGQPLLCRPVLDLPVYRKVYGDSNGVEEGHLMDVTVLYFVGCPHWEVVDERLAALADELGLAVSHREVTSPEEAERLGFRGSPSIVVDGRDVFAEGDEPVGLSCRIYQTPQGQAGAPTMEQLRAALG